MMVFVNLLFWPFFLTIQHFKEDYANNMNIYDVSFFMGSFYVYLPFNINIKRKSHNTEFPNHS